MPRPCRERSLMLELGRRGEPPEGSLTQGWGKGGPALLARLDHRAESQPRGGGSPRGVGSGAHFLGISRKFKDSAHFLLASWIGMLPATGCVTSQTQFPHLLKGDSDEGEPFFFHRLQTVN